METCWCMSEEFNKVSLGIVFSTFFAVSPCPFRLGFGDLFILQNSLHSLSSSFGQIRKSRTQGLHHLGHLRLQRRVGHLLSTWGPLRMAPTCWRTPEVHPTWSGRSGPLAAKCGVGHSHVLAILTDFWLISLGFFRHPFQFRYGDWPWLAQYASVLPWLIFVWLLQRMALHHLRLPWWGFERGQQQFLGCYTATLPCESLASRMRRRLDANQQHKAILLALLEMAQIKWTYS